MMNVSRLLRAVMPCAAFQRSLLMGMLLSVSAVVSVAEEPDGETSVYLMEEIVVSETAQTSPSEILIGDEWIGTRRAGTAADILAGVPGVSVTVGTKNSANIMIRGFRTGDVLVMVDGRPINETYYGDIDLSTIGLGDVSRIRVVKGASSVRYGPNAMGGVVNIITGAADDGFPLELKVTGGTGRAIRTDLMHRGRIHKDLRYRIHFGRDMWEGFPLSADFEPASIENGGLRDNSDFRRTDYGAKVFVGEGLQPRWSLGFSGSHMVKGLPAAVDESRYWRFRTWNRTAIDLDGEPVRSDAWRVKTKLYGERFLNELVDYRTSDFNPNNVFYDSTHDNRNAGFLLSSAYMPGGNRLTNLGFQVRWEESNRQGETGQDWFRNRIATTWVFAEHERAPSTNILVRGGLSGHYFTYDSWKRSSTSLDPSLYLAWTAGACTFSGAVSRVSRFPTLHQLYSRSSGNSDLKPERALKGEITAAGNMLGVFDLSAAWFASRVHDIINRSGQLARYHNIDRADLYGVDVGAKLTLPLFDLSSSVSLLSARDNSGERLEYRPGWKIDTALNYRVFPGVRFHAAIRVVGRRRTELDSDLDAYHVEDAGVVLFEDRRVSASLNLKNIFDANYEEELGYPVPGRTIWTGLDCRLGKR